MTPVLIVRVAQLDRLGSAGVVSLRGVAGVSSMAQAPVRRSLPVMAVGGPPFIVVLGLMSVNVVPFVSSRVVVNRPTVGPPTWGIFPVVCTRSVRLC